MSNESDLMALLERVEPVDPEWTERAWKRLDSLTKPPRSLGRLEELAARVATVQRTERPEVTRKAIVLAAADHGVVAEGVSAYPAEVTAQMVANIAHGGAAISQIAGSIGAAVLVIDVGVAGDVSGLGEIVHKKVRPGTANMAEGPAMSREEAAAAVFVGLTWARRLSRDGYQLLGTGEMGIGNSTAAAALTAAYTGASPEEVVGAGTGLDDAGVAHKAEVVRRALEVNGTSGLDALGILAAVGGLEIAALAGAVLGCGIMGTCIVTDGFISGSAALAATRLCPDVAGYVFPSHRSCEPGHSVVLEALGMEPVLDLDMRLGEGTGAGLAMALIDAACWVMSGMATFEEAGVSGADA